MDWYWWLIIVVAVVLAFLAGIVRALRVRRRGRVVALDGTRPAGRLRRR